MNAGGFAAALLVAALSVVAVDVNTARADGPTASVNTDAAAPGDVVLVDLEGWPEAASITGLLCGNAARRGSQDCAQTTGTVQVFRPGDRNVMRIPVVAPPMPCPCVVRVTNGSDSSVIDLPLQITDHPVAATVGVNQPPPGIDVEAHLVSTSDGSALGRVRVTLGGPRTYDVVVRVTNRKGADIHGLIVSAAAGRSGQPGETLDSPAPIDLAPGQARDIVLPLRIDAPTIGRYRVGGTVIAGNDAVTFEVTTLAVPWGLLVVLLLVVLDLAFVVVAVIARRRRPVGEPFDVELVSAW